MLNSNQTTSENTARNSYNNSRRQHLHCQMTAQSY